MFKRDRPWNKASNIGPPDVKKLALSCDDIPYVEIEGTKYFSDRFYLNVTALDYVASSLAAGDPTCNCGAKHPPPLFSREALVKSCGKLKAVILGTYTFELAALIQEFPSLFGAAATTPCLVLHGKKGWGRKKESAAAEEEPESEPLDEEDSIVDGDDDDTVGTQEEATVEGSKQFHAASSTPTPPTPLKSKCSPPQFPETLHFSEITPTWLSQRDIPTSFSAAIDKETGFLQQATIDKRLYKRGVHHPKFMILIEESGSVVVVVSTANFTRALATDASWVQRFPAAATAAPSGAANSQSNNFGAVLANFLQCEMLSTAADQVTGHWFVRKYLGWKSVIDLERSFDYSNAQVQLVATVPGDYERNSNLQNDTSKHLLYGQQRITDLVERLSLPSLQTDEDRLIFQPTSFGGDWNVRNMADLVRSYLGERQNYELRDQAVLERMDIVWPTEYFVREAVQILEGRNSPSSIADDHGEMGFSTDLLDDFEANLEMEKTNGGFLFLSSETFNKIDLTCLNRMVMFEPSIPPQRPLVLTPHFKSVARLFRGSDYRMRKDFRVPKCEEYFSWFLLTSACLSRGAQGEAVGDRTPESDTVAYSNFELGVLFCSRLAGPHGESRKNRIYCWKPSQCSCARPSTGPRLIHLPSPYCFRPARYVEDEDEAMFCETPYFHEVLPGTGCVGNMQLTPYGEALAARFDKEASLPKVESVQK